MTRFAHSDNNNAAHDTGMIYRGVIRRFIYTSCTELRFVARPPLKTAMTAGACARICMNERIVRAYSTVLIRITIDPCSARSPQSRYLPAICRGESGSRFARVSNTCSEAGKKAEALLRSRIENSLFRITCYSLPNNAKYFC